MELFFFCPMTNRWDLSFFSRGTKGQTTSIIETIYIYMSVRVWFNLVQPFTMRFWNLSFSSAQVYTFRLYCLYILYTQDGSHPADALPCSMWHLELECQTATVLTVSRKADILHIFPSESELHIFSYRHAQMCRLHFFLYSSRED